MKVLKNILKLLGIMIFVVAMMGMGALFALLVTGMIHILGSIVTFLIVAGCISLIIWIIWLTMDRD